MVKEKGTSGADTTVETQNFASLRLKTGSKKKEGQNYPSFLLNLFYKRLTITLVKIFSILKHLYVKLLYNFTNM